ncbi:MAG: hypothetical protein DMG65_10925 [Candidatus Angelobacter sp. Gp1-AA117]|nr:MAG: hypothetical protein DMG65_10925 [Candidatus Angelobacter sp. Gp1-AA117]
MWIRSNIGPKSGAGEKEGNIPNSGRFLELADIALGVKKPESKKKKAAAAGVHSSEKTEPYSR